MSERYSLKWPYPSYRLISPEVPGDRGSPTTDVTVIFADFSESAGRSRAFNNSHVRHIGLVSVKAPGDHGSSMIVMSVT